MTRKEHFQIILILGALATISPLSIDMYLPGFPAIANDLNTTIANVQLSLTSYFVGIAIGQLFYGPLLDKFGRKQPLYIGLIIYILSSIGCAFTNTVEGLIAMRFLQALGGCVGMVAAQALVRDIFPLSQTAQAFSFITLVIAVSPLIAPTAGGYITAAYNWHWVFILLAVITALFLLWAFMVLPQGNPADLSLSITPKNVFKNFVKVCKKRQFLVYASVGSIATSAPFAYIAGSADVFINIYGMSEQEYGWIFAFLASAIIGATQLNHFILKRFTSEQVINFALLYQSIIGIVLIAGNLFNFIGLIGMVALMFVFLTGQGLLYPNAAALSLAPFKKHAGSAAALMGSFRMAVGGVVSALVSFFHNDTVFPMLGGMLLCTVIALAILYLNSIIKENPHRLEFHGQE